MLRQFMAKKKTASEGWSGFFIKKNCYKNLTATTQYSTPCWHGHHVFFYCLIILILKWFGG